jgi:hypothetical protein
MLSVYVLPTGRPALNICVSSLPEVLSNGDATRN